MTTLIIWSGESDNGEEQRPEAPDDYQLKIDEQVTKFLEFRHKLTFFIVTASVGTLGFTLTKVATAKERAFVWPAWLILLTLAAIGALLSAGFALYSVDREIRSFQLHLKYRYQKKSYEELNENEQRSFDNANDSAGWSRKWSFKMLVGSVVLQVLFFLLIFYTQGGNTMHHYGEDAIRVVSSDSTHYIEFQNKETGKRITMQVPQAGVFENPNEELSSEGAAALAREVAHVLRVHLESAASAEPHTH